ncbi:MAG: DsbA family protein [Leptospirales bacterium]|jgi:2-hydroxychromene-2-carboxylate isomerase
MSLRKQIIAQVAVILTSPRLRTLRRAWFEFKRVVLRRPRSIDVFLRAADPYSYLLACELPDFAREQRLRVRLHTVLDLPTDMTPHLDLLETYSRADVARIARMRGHVFPGEPRLPAPDLLRAATILLLQCEAEPGQSGVDSAARILRALWQNDRSFFAQLPGADSELNDAHRAALKANEELLRRLGHYNSAMIFYGGEWYWGVDRLWHLSQRLTTAGAGETSDKRDAGPPGQRGVDASNKRRIDFYFSFRSPYSYLALSRVFALVDRHNLELKIKPVLPMVMRGLKVPRSKRFYILKDAGREAERHAIPFGRVADPLGVGVERCMAGFACALKRGREREFLLSAATMIWSEGVDVATDRGLAAVVERAGLDWLEFQTYLQNDEWRAVAEENQNDLYSLGLWGVPALRVGDTVVWGQDRFDVLDNALRNQS